MSVRGRRSRFVVARLVRFVSVSASLGLGVAWTFAAIDVARRLDNAHTPFLRHIIGTLTLYALAAAGFGLVAGVVMTLEHELHARLALRRPRLALFVRGLLFALFAGACVFSTAFWMFSGGRVNSTRMAKWGPWAIVAAVSLSAFALAIVGTWAARARERGRWIGPLLFALSGFAAAGALIYIDLNVYVALYARLHTLAEVMAGVIAVCVLGALLHPLLFRGRGRKIAGFITVATLAWLFVFVVWKRPRTWLARDLRHAWLEPVYAGRMLSRAQAAEAYLSNPAGWKGAGFIGVDRLKEQYDLGSTTLSPMWEEPLNEPPALKARLDAVRKKQKLNVLVYYVDTLRADVAADPRVMPSLSEFNQQSLSFARAYAPGSDTARSLPALTTGRYVPKESDEDIIQTGRAHGYKTALVIPQSAHEFLQKEVKGFRFEETVEVLDYAPVRTDVWGYGADRPSAGPIVDQLLDWLRKNQEKSFFVWAFNFDQHNWREISDQFIADSAQRFSMPVNAGRPRYEIVARSIDAEFGRLLKGLDELGLSKNTIVLFVSDHGEGLGRDGFWVHSIFLWESLVRVPLSMRVPGVPPKLVSDPVSLVDLAPTLARFFNPKIDTARYQGDDLLAYSFPERPARQRPILMQSGTHDAIRRIGIIEPKSQYKLVLQLESGVPELYDVNIDDPDWISVADENSTQTMSMLNRLVRSPLFPRPVETR
jgi:hypothetical protein